MKYFHYEKERKNTTMRLEDKPTHKTIRLSAAWGTSTPPPHYGNGNATDLINGKAKDKRQKRRAKPRMAPKETAARAVVHRRLSLTARQPNKPPQSPLGTPPQGGVGEQWSSPVNRVRKAPT